MAACWRSATIPRMSRRCGRIDIPPIDLLVVNLYPFEATVARGADFDDCIENIDIGGPAMIRAAAKNHDDVAVVVDAERLCRAARRDDAKHGGMTTLALRRQLAAKAYARTAAYDAAISNWFAGATRRYRARLSRLRRPADRGVCATAKTRTSRRRSIARRSALRRRHGAPGAGQAALLQQHQRHRRGLRVRRRIRSGAHRGLRHHQARQSLRRRRRRQPASTPTARRWPAIRSRPSAASSRSTARSMPRRRAPSPRSSPKSSSRPTPPTKPSPSSARRRICGCCWPAACPIRAPRD